MEYVCNGNVCIPWVSTQPQLLWKRKLSQRRTELVGVTVGEAQNPRRVIPRAIKLTFWRIVVFYVLSVLL